MKPRQSNFWKVFSTPLVIALLSAAISVACALGYLDLRFPDLGWREANPQLASWFFEVSQRPSMIATMPKP